MVRAFEQQNPGFNFSYFLDAKNGRFAVEGGAIETTIPLKDAKKGSGEGESLRFQPG